MPFLEQVKNKLHFLALPLIFIIGILVRLPYLSQSIWLDESYSVAVAGKSLRQIPLELAKDSSAPLHYYLLHFWMQAFGKSEVVVRSLSLLIGMLTLLVFFLIAKRLLGDKAGLLATTLLATSPFHTEFSQETRMYSLLVLFSLLSTFFFLEMLNKRRYWLLLGVINGLLILTHYWGFFLIETELLVAFWHTFTDKKRKSHWIVEMVKSAALSVVFFLPWFSVFWQQLGNNPTSWMHLDTYQLWFAPVRSLRYLLGLPSLCFVAKMVGEFHLVLASVGFVCLFLFQKGKTTRLWQLFFLWTIPLLIAQIISFRVPIYFAKRYDILVLPIFCLFAGMILARAHAKRGLVIFFLILCCNTVSLAQLYAQPKSAYRVVAASLLSRAKENDLFIFTSLARTPFDYYYSQWTDGVSIDVVNFPSFLGVNPGFIDEKSMALRKDEVAADAEEIATSCKEHIDEGSSCYLIYALDEVLNPPLLEAMEKQLGKAKETIEISERQRFYGEVVYKF
ncbi:MAG: glycosyltransferase family 39 protein [bacterium]